MEANKATSKKELKRKCKYHPQFTCDLINLDGDGRDRFMCFNCVNMNSIPFTNLMIINNVLESNGHEVLVSYPPLRNSELLVKLMNCNLH